MSFYSERQYREWPANHANVIRRIFIEDFGENRPGPQLDLGCSIGNFIALDPGRISGGDVDADALEICSRRGLSARHIDVSQENVLEPEGYEVIYLRHVIEHFENPLPVLGNVLRGLKPGGLCVLETPDYRVAHRRRRKNFWDDYTHKRPYTPTALERAALDAGFSVRRWLVLPDLDRISRILIRRGRCSVGTLSKIKSWVGMRGSNLAFILEKPLMDSTLP